MLRWRDAPRGRVGMCAECGTGARNPQSQNVTRMRCALVACGFPAIMRRPVGKGWTGARVKRRSSRPSRGSAGSASIPGTEREPNTRTDRQHGRTLFRSSAAMRRSRKRSLSGFRRTCEKWGMPGLPGYAIGSSGAAWVKRQLWMNSTPKKSLRDTGGRLLWIQRLSTRGGSSTHKDGEGKPDDANADKPVSSHGVALPSWRQPNTHHRVGAQLVVAVNEV